jgi:hypothetical protein
MQIRYFDDKNKNYLNLDTEKKYKKHNKKNSNEEEE